MSLSARTYLEEVMPTIEGWLYPGAVEVSELLINIQESLGIAGCGLEIGVYKAAYLSYLAAASEGEWHGLDIFLFRQKPEAEANISRVIRESGSKSNVVLNQVNSQTLTPETLKRILGNIPLKFASVDGDHSAAGVFHDMAMIEKNLSPGGIVAVDDVFSPMNASVSEGVFRYLFSTETELRPVVFSDNKLFLTTEGFDEPYQIGLKIALHHHTGKIGNLWRDDQQINRIRPFLNGQLMHL